MDELVQVPANHLAEILSRLTDRRIAVEKELGALGEGRKGANEVFRHCRGFERAYSVLLQDASVAFKIRAVVEGNLPETLRRIPIEKRFNKNYVREVCREADGYQAHLVSPEKGIRRLVAEAMALTTDHVHKFVDDVHLVLTETVREAAKRSVLTEAGLGPNALPREIVTLKGFEAAVVQAATTALDDWKAEAHKVAETMVQMECDYVTPSFFRELEKQYQLEQQAQGAEGEGGNDRLNQLATGNVTADDGEGDSDSEDTATSPGASRGSTTGREVSPARGGFAMPGSQQPPQQQQQQLNRDDLKAGWLDKRAGEGSNLASLPVSSVKWQRRWFVLAMESGFLYYFKSPSEMSSPGVSPKVTINLRECLVEDFQTDAAIGSEKKSQQKLDNNAGSVSTLIRILHKNPNKPVAKNHHQMVLRAENASDKFEWLARLRHATEPGVGSRARGVAAGQAAPGPAGAAQAGQRQPSQDKEEKGLFGRTADKMGDTFAKFAGWGGSKVGYVLQEGAIQDLDAYYEKLGNFTGIYARHAFDRMAKTVPKAIILCQVIRSRDRLLDQLYNYLSNLKPVEMEALLAEDPQVARRRTAAQQASRDLADAQLEVRKIEEARASESPRRPSANVSLRALLLAGAYPLVPKDKVPQSIDPVKIYGEFTPVSLLQGVDTNAPPPLRASENGAPGGTGGRPAARTSSDGSTGAAAAVRPTPAGPPQLERPSAASSGSATKPRRMPPPPPPKMG